MARAVHERSTRNKGPFVAINCATIPATLIESVLFGHERGAFTGATERHAGVFERSHGGSVFLDEVGELSPVVQAALLRTLETKRIMRVGSNKEVELDLRVIAATHRNLPAMVASRVFREDLLFRLDALSLHVPPLRERRTEIEPLAQRFLQDAGARWGGHAVRFSSEVMTALIAYDWPGNVRQLKNVVERAAVLCAGETIGLADLPDTLQNGFLSLDEIQSAGSDRSSLAREDSDESTDTPRDAGDSLEASVQDYERRLIGDALARTGGNQSKAALLLKIPRRTLTHKIHALGLGRSR